jgi:hypothetical protein
VPQGRGVWRRPKLDDDEVTARFGDCEPSLERLELRCPDKIVGRKPQVFVERSGDRKAMGHDGDKEQAGPGKRMA